MQQFELQVLHDSYKRAPWWPQELQKYLHDWLAVTKVCLVFCRHEFATQVVQLASELSVLQSSFQRVQDFVQLPTIRIWHRQFQLVMSQALSQDLQALSPARVVPKQASSAALPHQASSVSQPNQASSALEPNQASSVPEPNQVSGVTVVSQATHQQQNQTSALHSSAPTSDVTSTTAANKVLLSKATQHSLPSQATLPAQSGLPNQAGAPSQAGLPTQARTISVTQQATERQLPKQATFLKSSFLSRCLSELLRLSDPYSSQYQPLLCGWYDTAGEQIVGLG